MSLPDFVTVAVYARKEGDLPQRFYMTPELETLSDCRLEIQDGIFLPVHSQILALRSGMFKDMLSSTSLGKKGTIPFRGHILDNMLIALRFMYDPVSLTKENVKFIYQSDMLTDTLRSVHALDLVCATTIHDMISTNLTTLNEICTVFNAAKTFDDSRLLSGCYQAVLRWIRSTRARCNPSQAFGWICEIRECPELMQCVMMYCLCGDYAYDGDKLRYLFGSTSERIPDADYTWIIMKPFRQRLSRNPRGMIASHDFMHGNVSYKCAIRHNNDYNPRESSYASDDDVPEDEQHDVYNVHVYLKEKSPSPRHVAFTLRLIDMNTACVKKEVVCRGQCTEAKWTGVYAEEFMTDEDLRECSDDSGMNVLQIIFH